MTCVQASSRLHFGLLNTRGQFPAVRQFGGCGLMIREPGVIVQLTQSDHWQAEGPASQRALNYAQQVLALHQIDTALAIRVLLCPPEHVGLGVGTQLALATIAAVETELQLTPKPSLAEQLGRGQRSAIGLYGFHQGGFLVDAGRTSTGPAPLLARYPFPDHWRVLLIRPRELPTPWSGDKEAAAFQLPHQANWATVTDQMCRWLVLGLIPSLLQQDFAGFSEALFEYNRLAGEQFAREQGGIYSAAKLTEIVEQVRRLGPKGVGQSSWGPTLFAICEDDAQARWLQAQLQAWDSSLELVLTRANNQPALVSSVTVG